MRRWRAITALGLLVAVVTAAVAQESAWPERETPWPAPPTRPADLFDEVVLLPTVGILLQPPEGWVRQLPPDSVGEPGTQDHPYWFRTPTHLPRWGELLVHERPLGNLSATELALQLAREAAAGGLVETPRPLDNPAGVERVQVEIRQAAEPSDTADEQRRFLTVERHGAWAVVIAYHGQGLFQPGYLSLFGRMQTLPTLPDGGSWRLSPDRHFAVPVPGGYTVDSSPVGASRGWSAAGPHDARLHVRDLPTVTSDLDPLLAPIEAALREEQGYHRVWLRPFDVAEGMPAFLVYGTLGDGRSLYGLYAMAPTLPIGTGRLLTIWWAHADTRPEDAEEPDMTDWPQTMSDDDEVPAGLSPRTLAAMRLARGVRPIRPQIPLPAGLRVAAGWEDDDGDGLGDALQLIIGLEDAWHAPFPRVALGIEVMWAIRNAAGDALAQGTLTTQDPADLLPGGAGLSALRLADATALASILDQPAATLHVRMRVATDPPTELTHEASLRQLLAR